MANKEYTHESFQAQKEVKVGSERSFGIVFAIVFTLIGLHPLINGDSIRLWAAGIALAFLIVALVMPRILKPLNIIWFKFGLVLHAVVNPLIMGLLFFFTITPIALIFKLLGKDPLSLTLDADAKSYWVHRNPAGPDPQTMKRQF